MSWITDYTPYQYGNYVAGFDEVEEGEEIQWVIQKTHPNANAPSILEVEDGWAVEEKDGVYRCLDIERPTVYELLQAVARYQTRKG